MGIMNPGNDRQRGVSTVEMAIVLPLLLVLILGTIEYGWMFLHAQQVTNAARQGARTAVLPYSTNTTVETAVGSLMTAAGMGDSGYTLTLTPEDIGDVVPHQNVNVEVTVPYANITLIGVPFVPVPAVLRGSVTMVKEGA